MDRRPRPHCRHRRPRAPPRLGAQRDEVRRDRDQVRRLPRQAAPLHRAHEEVRGARHPRLVRLPQRQRPLPRDAGDPRARPPDDPRPGQPHRRRHPRRRHPGQHLHRDTGPRPERYVLPDGPTARGAVTS